MQQRAGFNQAETRARVMADSIQSERNSFEE
jgi:hypothetical protein